MMRNKLSVLTGLLLLLAGCTSFLPGQGPPPRLFTLSPKTTFSEAVVDAPRVGWQLVVEPPYAPQSLNATRIALMISPMRLDQYARANWTDRAPVLVQDLMVQSFDSTRKIMAVGRESVGVRPDYVLKTELRDFQGEVIAPDLHRVRVRMAARLVRMPQRIIVASEDFQAEVEVAPQQMENVVAGFDEALGKVLKRLVDWTLRAGEADWRRRDRS